MKAQYMFSILTSNNKTIFDITESPNTDQNHEISKDTLEDDEIAPLINKKKVGLCYINIFFA